MALQNIAYFMLILLWSGLVPVIWMETLACPKHCTCLYPQQHLHCQNASMTSVPSNIATNTSELNLSGNQFFTLQTNSFASLSSLTVLYVSECEISEIQPGAFNGLGSLKYLHLDSNEITELQETAFENITTVLYLHLEYNKIASLKPGMFSSMKKLIALYLNNNNLTELADGSFQGLVQLRWLYLSNNHISNISSKAFSSMKNLRRLYLDGNNLMSVPSSALRAVKGISVLVLSRNPIEKLTGDSFGRKLSFLTELYLDNATLKEVSSRAFTRFRALQVLSMRDNHLETLQSLKPLRNLQSLSLSGNNWRCDCQMTWLRGWLLTDLVNDNRYEVKCSSPEALKGQLLMDVQIQHLTCPPYELSGTTILAQEEATLAMSAVTTKIPQLQTTKITTSTPRTTATTTASTSKHLSMDYNQIPIKSDPCLSDYIDNISAREIQETSLTVSWSFSGDGDQFEIRYSNDDHQYTLQVIGGLSEVILQNLHPGSTYKVCLIPQNKYISKCLAPSEKQCMTQHTPGIPGNTEAIHSDPTHNHYALTVGISITVLIIVILALIIGWKLKSSAFRFQRYYDEEGSANIDHVETEEPKLDTDLVYEKISDSNHFYVMPSAWRPQVNADEDRMDCNFSTPVSLLSTPRYVTLENN
ncbi:chondroadherin-like [Protopterus annectens]|uniref:chondroadherin-like n=1 Tax=Protopterus annectens TaxID=7888 RepID=UPI001CFA88EF|nr:chondroadherin-like [Protopterus annectens]XP_043931692.1 chondroadherin-like [Protopterus annectens]